METVENGGRATSQTRDLQLVEGARCTGRADCLHYWPPKSQGKCSSKVDRQACVRGARTRTRKLAFNINVDSALNLLAAVRGDRTGQVSTRSCRMVHHGGGGGEMVNARQASKHKTGLLRLSTVQWTCHHPPFCLLACLSRTRWRKSSKLIAQNCLHVYLVVAYTIEQCMHANQTNFAHETPSTYRSEPMPSDGYCSIESFGART